MCGFKAITKVVRWVEEQRMYERWESDVTIPLVDDDLL